MIQFPQELLNSKWDTLSPEIREILLSDSFDSNIETIISSLGLSEFADKIIDLCTYAVYGLLDQNAFFKELTDLIGGQKSPDLAKRLIVEVIIPTVTLKYEAKAEIKVEGAAPVIPTGANPSPTPTAPEPAPTVETPKEAFVDHPMPVIEAKPIIEEAPAISKMAAPVISISPDPLPMPVISSEAAPIVPSEAPTSSDSLAPAQTTASPANIAPKFEDEPSKNEPAPTPSAAAPFIIHVERENTESVSETKANLNLSPVRPVFYEDKETGEDSAPKAAFVKLQFSAPTTNHTVGDKLKESKDISLSDLPVQ